MPSDPAIAPASSERMSPKRFSVTTTSKRRGSMTRAMANASTYWCSSATSGYSFASFVIVARHNCDDSSTLALSTDSSFFRRPRASSKATRDTRSTSAGV
jgi:hypothetical protein